jgi:hypothetical protein
MARTYSHPSPKVILSKIEPPLIEVSFRAERHSREVEGSAVAFAFAFSVVSEVGRGFSPGVTRQHGKGLQPLRYAFTS